MLPESLLGFITALDGVRQKEQVLRLCCRFPCEWEYLRGGSAHVYCSLIMRDKPAAFLSKQVSMQINSAESNMTRGWIVLTHFPPHCTYCAGLEEDSVDMYRLMIGLDFFVAPVNFGQLSKSALLERNRKHLWGSAEKSALSRSVYLKHNPD